MATIAVTGSTGHIGGAVASALANEGFEQRLIVRDEARAPALAGAITSEAHYGSPESASALAGIDVLFMISAAEAADRREQQVAFVEAAARVGVRHIVYTSFTAAGPDATFTLARDHGATEDAIRASGMGFTILRDNFYLDVLPYFADADGTIRGPAGDGRVAAVARADVADAAVAVIREVAGSLDRGVVSVFSGTTWNLTGGEAMTLTELTYRVGRSQRREMRFINETLDEAYASRAHYGADGWQVDAWVSTYTAIRDGQCAPVTDDVLTLTGHPPRRLEDVL
jgi:uncharacterized protein YbjT (DUF2867 family)